MPTVVPMGIMKLVAASVYGKIQIWGRKHHSIQTLPMRKTKVMPERVYPSFSRSRKFRRWIKLGNTGNGAMEKVLQLNFLGFKGGPQSVNPPQKVGELWFAIFCFERNHCFLSNTLNLLIFSLSNSRSKIQTTPFARLRTPPTSPEDAEELLNQSAESKKNCHVQFGSPKAAEYDIDGPTGWLTPLPPHVAKKRFSMDQKATTQEEEEVTEETKQNSALLAAWEESFEEPSSTSRRRRQKNRRSSSLFSPSPSLTDGKADNSLLADWDESPISVDDKGGRKSINPPPVELISNNATPSPSAEVAKGLESLGFDSPDTDAFGNELNFSGAVGESTAEFRVDLNDVNTLGGALQESSPPGAFGPCGTPQRRRLLKSPLAAKENNSDLTPPPVDDSLESVHSVGGALDRESPPGSHIQSNLADTCERGDITDDIIPLSQTRFEAEVSLVVFLKVLTSYFGYI